MTEKEKSEKPKRRRLSHDARRAQFVEQAIEFFAQEGFESSTRRLAERLNVTQPLLYRYFPSKSDLIKEVYEEVYLQRWREEWLDLLTDRSRPAKERIIEFYRQYTGVIFNDDWMRIFLFSGLKGLNINRQYLGLVRERIIKTILTEILSEEGIDPSAITKEDVEFGWTIHGAIFYYGVRKVIYKANVHNDKDFVITSSVECLIHHLKTAHAAP